MAAVHLQASDAQARHAVGLNRALPGHELFDRQLVAPANFFETDGPAAHRVNDHCLAPGDPTLCLRRRQVDRHDVDLSQNLVFRQVLGYYALGHHSIIVFQSPM